MESLNRGGWNNADSTADLGAFVIDHINLFGELEYKDNSEKIKDIFCKLYNDPIILEEFRRVSSVEN